MTKETRKLAPILAGRRGRLSLVVITGADEERMLARLRALRAALYKLVCFDALIVRRWWGSCAKPGLAGIEAPSPARGWQAIMISTNS